MRAAGSVNAGWCDSGSVIVHLYCLYWGMLRIVWTPAYLSVSPYTTRAPHFLVSLTSFMALSRVSLALWTMLSPTWKKKKRGEKFINQSFQECTFTITANSTNPCEFCMDLKCYPITDTLLYIWPSYFPVSLTTPQHKMSSVTWMSHIYQQKSLLQRFGKTAPWFYIP